MRERTYLTFLLMSTVVIVAVLAVLISSVLLEESRLAGDPYPRLGMWWLDPYKWSVAEMSPYLLIIDNFDDQALSEKLQGLRQSPYRKIYKPISPTERSWYIENPETGELMENPEIRSLPSSFFLSQTGTQLTYAINRNQNQIVVDQMVDGYGAPLFNIDGTVMIGKHESAKVVAIDESTKTLTLERGFLRPAQDHTQGTRIASHITFWPQTWVMNITTQCPSQKIYGIKEPVNYLDYFFSLNTGESFGIYPSAYVSPDALNNLHLYDGIAIDRLEDRQDFLKWLGDQEIQIDLYQDNRSTTREDLNRYWLEGVEALVAKIKGHHQGLRIIRNNPMSDNTKDYQGQIYETFGWEQATNAWWKDLVVEGQILEGNKTLAYLEWPKGSTLLFEVYEDESFPKEVTTKPQWPDVPNYQRMRFGLTSALMGEGYFSYELSTNGHGSLGLAWFDEYDLGTGKTGYLGYPKSEPESTPEGAYLRYFSKGVVVVNPTPKVVDVKLGAYYQHIQGKQDPIINNGTIQQAVELQPFDGVILLRLPLLYQWTYNAQQFEE